MYETHIFIKGLYFRSHSIVQLTNKCIGRGEILWKFKLLSLI
jgi:hypothetical protein